MDYTAWPSTQDIPVLTGVSYHTKIDSIWNGFKCVVSLSWPKPTVMVYYHPYGTHTKYDTSPDSDGLPCMTLNTGYPVLTCVSYNAKICSVHGSFGYVVPLILPNSNVMVYYHPSGTHSKHAISPDIDGMPCMTLNTGYPNRDLRLLPCKNRLCLGWIWVNGTIAMVQAHCDVLLSSIWDPFKACCITRIAMEYPIWPSTTGIPIVTCVYYHTKIDSV